jgi:hypothetical protein
MNQIGLAERCETPEAAQWLVKTIAVTNAAAARQLAALVELAQAAPKSIEAA